MNNEQLVACYMVGVNADADSNLYYTGTIMYSYGPHHPLAIINRVSKTYYINPNKRSITTAKHYKVVTEGLDAAGYKCMGTISIDNYRNIVLTAMDGTIINSNYRGNSNDNS